MEKKNAFAETIKMVEDDFYKFNEMVDQNLRIESDIEKQLEKEDKKCTFLKHTIKSLKKRLVDTERICTDQRNYIFDLQMETEQISSTIYEQMEVKRIAYPEEDAKPYREMVDVAQRMVDYITNFKTIIQQNIDDCSSRKMETHHWKNTSNELLNRISELKVSKSEVQSKLNQLTNDMSNRSLENIKSNASRLQKIHCELRDIKISYHEVVAEKNKLDGWKQQIITESIEKKTSLSLMRNDYDNLKKSPVDEMNIIRAEITAAGQQYLSMINETRTFLDIIEKQLNKYEYSIKEKSVVLEEINGKEIDLKSEYERILLNIKNMGDQLSKIEELNQTLEKQELFSKNMYTSTQQYITASNTRNKEHKIHLKNLTEQLEKLKNNSDLISANCHKSNDTFKFEAKSNLENMKKLNDEFEKEHKKLKQEINDLRFMEKELKLKQHACDVEAEFLNLLFSKISEEIHQKTWKINKEMNIQIGKCIENVTELSNLVAEKKLLLDSVKADVQKWYNVKPLLETRIETLNKENLDKKAKLSQIEETINNEEKNLQSKVNLLEDLEKNTFPKNKIPTEWLQSLQDQKNEYEKLKVERIGLEEKRNNLKKIGKDSVTEKSDLKLSQIFSETDPKKQRLDLEMKSAAYKMFKERIMKKAGAPVLG